MSRWKEFKSIKEGFEESDPDFWKPEDERDNPQLDLDALKKRYQPPNWWNEKNADRPLSDEGKEVVEDERFDWQVRGPFTWDEIGLKWHEIPKFDGEMWIVYDNSTDQWLASALSKDEAIVKMDQMSRKWAADLDGEEGPGVWDRPWDSP